MFAAEPAEVRWTLMKKDQQVSELEDKRKELEQERDMLRRLLVARQALKEVLQFDCSRAVSQLAQMVQLLDPVEESVEKRFSSLDSQVKDEMLVESNQAFEDALAPLTQPHQPSHQAEGIERPLVLTPSGQQLEAATDRVGFWQMTSGSNGSDMATAGSGCSLRTWSSCGLRGKVSWLNELNEEPEGLQRNGSSNRKRSDTTVEDGMENHNSEELQGTLDSTRSRSNDGSPRLAQQNIPRRPAHQLGTTAAKCAGSVQGSGAEEIFPPRTSHTQADGQGPPAVLSLNIRSTLALRGDYGLASERINNYPVWNHEQGAFYIASDVNGTVVITDYDRRELQGSVCPAILASAYAHGGLLPHELKSWLRDVEEQWIVEAGVSINVVRSLADLVRLNKTIDANVSVDTPLLHSVADGPALCDRDDSYLDDSDHSDSVEEILQTRSLTLYHLPDPSEFRNSGRRTSTANF